MIRRLKMAIAIETHRSFHRAAEALGVSQPAITRGVQALEDEMGVRLFERGKNECVPTAFGKVVLARARRILSEVAESKREIALLQRLQLGAFSVGTGSGGVQHWLAAAVGQLCAANPNLRVRISEHHWFALPDLLMASEIDVAVGEASGLDGNSDIVVSRLPRRPVGLVCRAGHLLTKVGKLRIEDLQEYRLVGPPMPLRLANQLPARSTFGSLSADGRYFEPAILCSGWLAIREIVARSDSLAFRPLAVLRKPEKLGSLVILPFEAPWMTTEFAIMWRRDRMQPPALKAFRDIARRCEAAVFGSKASLRAVA